MHSERIVSAHSQHAECARLILSKAVANAVRGKASRPSTEGGRVQEAAAAMRVRTIAARPAVIVSKAHGLNATHWGRYLAVAILRPRGRQT